MKTMNPKIGLPLILSMVFLIGCTKAPSVARVEREVLTSIRDSWAATPGKESVTIDGITLSKAGKDQWSGTLQVSGKGWKEDVRVTVRYFKEELSWEVDKWSIGE